jgi:hypothetical protein
MAITALLCAASALAQAADTRHFAVLSLIGDEILIAQFFPDENGRLEKSEKQFMPLGDDVLDKTVLQAADQALKRMNVDLKPVLLAVRDPALYEIQPKLAENVDRTAMLFERILGLVKGSGATHLLLVSKLWHDSQIRETDATLGSGAILGVGFYVDAGPPLGAKSGTPGFLASFAYLRYQLVDVARKQVIKEETVLASKRFSAFSSGTGTDDPWHSLTSSQKVEALQELVRAQTAQVVPRLIGYSR